MSTDIVPVNERAIELTAVQANVLLARRQAVEKVVRELMQEGVHYGPVAPGVPGTMIYKAGTELLAASFQLALEYDVQTEAADDGRRYIATARVVHQPTGAFLGSAIGECSTHETKFKWRGAHRKEYDATPADRRREKFTKSGETYLQVREEADDKSNTALKMACKRAAADALQAVLGIRGMFVFETAERGGGRAAAPAASRATAKPKRASSAQLGKLGAVAKEAGVSDETLRAGAERDFGVKELAALTTAQASELIDRIGKLPPAGVDPVTGEVAAEASDEASDEATDYWPPAGGPEGLL